MSEMNNEQNAEIPETPETPETPLTPETPAASGALSKDEKTMAMLAHLLGIVTGFVGSLVIFLIKKDESEFIADQAKEALNFQITLCIASVAAMILNATIILMIIGVPLLLAAMVCSLIFSIMGALKANEGEHYRYPFAIRLVK